MESSDKEKYTCCPDCGKKLFKVKDGCVIIKCRGCHKEVAVPLGEFLKEKDGKHKNKK